MNTRFALPIALILGAAVLPACGDKAAEAKDAAAKVANFTPDSVKETISKATDSLKSLGDMTDLDAIKEKASGALTTLTTLSKAKAMLKDKMPDMSALSGVADTLKEKFAGKMDIMKVIQPILDQIKSLVG